MEKKCSWCQAQEKDQVMKLLPLIMGVQCVQRALLSCSLHVLQAYDEGE